MFRVLIEQTKGAIHIKTMGEVTILDTGDQLGSEHEYIIYINGEEVERCWHEPRQGIMKLLSIVFNKIEGERIK